MHLKQHLTRLCAAAAALALSACGGGGGSAPIANSDGIPPSVQSAQQCSADNTYSTVASRTGSLSTEKQWLRSYFDEAYLWYREVPVVDPAAAAYSSRDVYASLGNYFKALKTPAVTASGIKKDQFGFIYPTAQWQALSQSGVSAGYGFEAVFGSYVIDATHPTRNIRVAYTEPGTEATTKGLQRGDKLVTVDGVSADDTTTTGIAVLNAALFPTAVGSAHNWVFSRAGVTQPVVVTLTSANITSQPVLTRSVVTLVSGKKVGYMVFNDHIATAEGQIVEAVNYFKTQAIDELVLDIRYNGGGYLYIASELAYMVSGPVLTQGQVFEQLVYSDKRSADTNSAGARTPFYNTSSAGAAFPSLNMARVYVIAQGGTCSASEAVINGLRGVNVDVHLIGGTTCGKPYGFTAKDNCGISYFPIEFKGANAQGFGDYADGFVPGGAGATGVPGCVVADDLTKPLGDRTEGMLAMALGHLVNGACAPLVSMMQPLSLGRSPAGSLPDAELSLMLRNPARENRILVPRP